MLSVQRMRVFLVYGAVLFLADQILIQSSRNIAESLAVVVAAIIIAVLLYLLLGKLFANRSS